MSVIVLYLLLGDMWSFFGSRMLRVDIRLCEGYLAEDLATGSRGVCLGADVSVKGQSLTSNLVFKLLVGLAGMC